MTSNLAVADHHRAIAGIEAEVDGDLHERTKQLARWLHNAGLVAHLGNTVEIAYFVAGLALQWRLPPLLVARSAYLGPGGRLDFEAKLQALLLMRSGLVAGLPKFYTIGDWSPVAKVRWEVNQKGNRIPVADWKPEAEIGLGVGIIITMTGETEPRRFELPLTECQPRISTRWATAPRQMCRNQCLKRFIDETVPHLLMTVPDEPLAMVPPAPPIDVTPPAGSAASGIFDAPRLADGRVLNDPCTDDAEQLGKEDALAGKPSSSPPHWSGRDPASVKLRAAYRRGFEAAAAELAAGEASGTAADQAEGDQALDQLGMMLER